MNFKRSTGVLQTLYVFFLCGHLACTGNLANDRGYGKPVEVSHSDFAALSAASYANKAKLVLTGLPATDAEVAHAQTRQGYAGLVDTWMQTPEYQQSLMAFFSEAFQQSQVTSSETAMQAGSGSASAVEVQLMQESFARTMLYMVQNNKAFSEAMTTTSFMMTPRLLMWYAYLEAIETNDNGNSSDFYQTRDPNFSFTLKTTGGTIDPSQSADPKSSNYMTWYYRAAGMPSGDPACALSNNQLTVNSANARNFLSTSLYSAIVDGSGVNYAMPNNVTCYLPGPGEANALATHADNTDWRMVALTVPADGNQATPFWDVQTMRTASTVALRIPRVGFFTTPSFLAQWATNTGNKARGVMNQTMITGLSSAFDGSDATLPASQASIDFAHAMPATPCFGCHISLDPMRQFFRSQLTLSFDVQRDPNETAFAGVWVRGGNSYVSTHGFRDLGQSMADDPAFAMAWVQKTCAWINSSRCSNTDPEIVRIAKDFSASNFSFTPMLRQLLLSDVTTYAGPTQTATTVGTTITIARREQLCKNLSNRLGIEDVCGLKATTQVPQALQPLQGMLVSYPGNGYSRGGLTPAAVTTPTLPMRTGLENACGYLSIYVVDNGNTSLFPSNQVDASITDMTQKLFGLGPARSAAAEAVLQGHYASAIKQGSSATDAMRSTFMLACLSPWVTMVGESP